MKQNFLDEIFQSVLEIPEHIKKRNRKMRIRCGSEIQSSYLEPQIPSLLEYGCSHPGDIDCDDCILTGGDLSPITGKKFRGNRTPYVEAAMEEAAMEEERIQEKIKPL